MTVTYGIAIPHYSSPRLKETLDHLPVGVPYVVIPTRDPHMPLAAAWNKAAKWAFDEKGFDALVLCNDDIILAPHTARYLAEGITGVHRVADRPFPDRKIVLVSAYNIRDVDIKVPLPNGKPHVTPSGPPSDWRGRQVYYGPEDLGGFHLRWGTGPDFSCFCITKETIDLIGPFDEVFDPAYFEDGDYHHRIRLAGFEALSLAPYWHWGSSTLANDSILASTFHPKFDRCQAVYVSKWGGLPGNEIFTRPYDPSSTIAPGAIWK